MSKFSGLSWVVVVIASLALPGGDICGATLVGHWAFDEGQGTVASDQVLGNHGTIHGATWVEGIGYALAFDGESTYVQIPNDSAYNNPEAVSVEALILMTPWQSCSEPDVFDKSHRSHIEPPYYTGYTFQGSPGGLMTFSLCGNSHCAGAHSMVSLNDSMWHFIAGTASVQDGVIRFYLDGEMINEAPFGWPIGVNDGDIFIGRHYLDRLGRYYSGLIDEVKVYDGALTAEEIWDHYLSIAGIQDGEQNLADPGEGILLEQRCPNPLMGTVTLSYHLPEPACIRLSLFNIRGERIRVLGEGFKSSGWHAIDFEMSDLASGVYFARLDAGDISKTNKLVLLQ